MKHFLPLAVVCLLSIDAAATEEPAAGPFGAPVEPAAEEAVPEEVEAVPEEVEAAPAEDPIVADLDPAWAVYEEAFRAAVREDLDEAAALLHQIINNVPDHPAASSADLTRRFACRTLPPKPSKGRRQ